MEGYCVKCRKKVEMENEEEEVIQNGKHIMKGTCPDCKKVVCRILPNEQ